VTENYHLVVKAKRKASSLIQFSIRAKCDTCLYNDVDDFLFKHDTSIQRLVDMLLNKDFTLARYTDPTYPISE